MASAAVEFLGLCANARSMPGATGQQHWKVRMKSRLTLIFAALVVLLGSMVWLVQDRESVAVVPMSAPAPLLASAAPSTPQRSPIPVAPAAENSIPWMPAEVPTTAPRAIKTVPTVGIDGSGAVTYVAREGDTVSELAGALLGSGSRDDRDAVIAANASLQADPDRVLTGQTYSIDVAKVRGDANVTADREPDAATTTPIAAANGDAPRVNRTSAGEAMRKTTVEASGPRLTYIAQLGDTVRLLAAQLLGGDTHANRNAIIAENASLQQDPDYLVAGQSYTIVARSGLAVDRTAPRVAGLGSQPNADDVIRFGAGRTLGYTARRGDTVSKLAAILLGSNTRRGDHQQQPRPEAGPRPLSSRPNLLDHGADRRFNAMIPARAVTLSHTTARQPAPDADQQRDDEWLSDRWEARQVPLPPGRPASTSIPTAPEAICQHCLNRRRPGGR
jgi:hypothetical protein